MFLRLLPYVALLFNAAVWGTSWWPLRHLQEAGLHPLWASAATYLLGSAVIVALKPEVLRELREHKALWLLGCAAGSTMVGFNWGVAIAEVIRVVLLFYLMPIWAVLLARWILHEPITGQALLRIVLALLGAVLVLSPEGSIGMPWPSALGEWLGLMGGAFFALNNVLLKHQSARSEQARLLGMFVGGVWVPAGAALMLSAWAGWTQQPELAAMVPWPGALSTDGVIVLLAFSVLLLLANYGLQLGASRLPANVTAVVMLSEVVFATASAIALTDETLSLQTAVGGGLIVLAALLSGLEGQQHG